MNSRPRATPVWLRIARAYLRASNPITYIARRSIKSLDEKTLFAGITRNRRLCVDVGAGTSPYRQEIADCLRIDRYIAMDIAPSDSTAVIADGSRMPIATGCIQLVTSFDSIQHIPNYAGLLDEVARVLEPGGAFVVTFPFNYCECDVSDYHRWTLAGMEFDLRAHGFELLLLTPRGGRFFALACGMNWVVQHLLPGQRQSWRMSKTAVPIVRAIVVQSLTLPTTLLQWIMLAIDRLLQNDGCYMGGIAVAVKPRSRFPL